VDHARGNTTESLHESPLITLIHCRVEDSRRSGLATVAIPRRSLSPNSLHGDEELSTALELLARSPSKQGVAALPRGHIGPAGLVLERVASGDITQVVELEPPDNGGHGGRRRPCFGPHTLADGWRWSRAERPTSGPSLSVLV
jgi:hypothetical protein